MIDIVDAEVLFSAARQGRRTLLHEADLPAPVTALGLTLGPEPGAAAFRLTGSVTAVPRRPFTRPEDLGHAMLPATAVAMLLGGVAGLVTLTVLGYAAYRDRRDRREAALSAARAAGAPAGHGAGHAPDGGGKQALPGAGAPGGPDDPRGPGDQPPPGTVVDADTGLVATLAATGPHTLTVSATVPAAVADSGRLAAFARILMTVAVRMSNAGDDVDFWTGRRLRLSRYPGGRSILPGSDVLRLDQIGGMDHVVAQLREVADSFNHPAAMARWGTRRPQGLLFYGPPGTGKTTLAKALAAEIGGRLREVRTPDILNKWVGSSERNIKDIFAEARRYRTPTVLLFDEFDSIISYVGAPDHSADQMVNSVAGIFKQEMNTLIAENPNVIVVATTNFPDKVDESLIRSGRFDVKLSVPLPSATGRAQILTGMLRQLIADHETDGFRMFADDVNVVELANVTPGLTGADLRELLRRVRMAKAMTEARYGAATPITQQDLLDALAGMRRHA
jgi:transitional endoplasmic reticulum ATPase